jgi:phage terminase large subunit GpA-like protein
MPFDAAEAARETVDTAWRRGIAPPPRRTPWQWADAERRLGNEEGPFAGKWSTDRTPYMRGPMEAMGLSHPASRVSVVGSAQIAKTQGAVNLLGQIATETAAAVLVVLPSIDEARAYNREKLQPMIDNTPSVRARVMDVKRADESGSTTMIKKFPGGSIELTGANSSKGLQMRTKRVVIMDEVSEFPFDVDGRGDPVEMAEARTTAYRKIRKEKIIKVSTPGLEGACRITAAYEESSRGVFHVHCPDCGHCQPLIFERLRYDAAKPHLAEYPCNGCGVLWREADKAKLLAGGVWVHERPELVAVHAGFRIDAMYSPFVTWGWIAAERERSRDDPLKDKVFCQQVLGRAYRIAYDTVPHQALYERRTEWATGRIPAPVLFLEGATDVQGDRLEWAVYGFDRHLGQWWIDGGILLGDPRLPDVWTEHDALLARRWPDAWGRDRVVESWGIDTGFLTQDVYRYVRRHAWRGEPRIMALDGRARWGEPPIGTPKKVDVDWQGRRVGSVMLWPVGTYDLKAELVSAMTLTQQGPDSAGVWPRGAMRFPTALDMGFFEQLTAEALNVRQKRDGYEVREWIKVRSRNEQLDLAVYTKGLARHDTARFTEADWTALTAKRTAPEPPTLIDLMQGGIAVEVATQMPPPPVVTRPRSVAGVGRSVF